MTAVKQLTATVRTRVGKRAARAVRRENRLPAVIYGGKTKPTTISLDAKTATLLIYAGHFLTTIFEIDVEGTKERVLPRDYQLDPVRGQPVHIDFLRLTKGETVRVLVPVHIEGQTESPGLKRGGSVNIVAHAVEMTVPADRIPEGLPVSVAALDIGDSIHLSEVSLPEGCRPVSAEAVTLVTIVPPTVVKDTAGGTTPAA